MDILSTGISSVPSKIEKGFFMLCEFMKVDLLRKEIQCNLSQELRSVEANIE